MALQRELQYGAKLPQLERASLYIVYDTQPRNTNREPATGNTPQHTMLNRVTHEMTYDKLNVSHRAGYDLGSRSQRFVFALLRDA